MLTALFDADTTATLSPDLKLKIISALAGTKNPVVRLVTGAGPNATNAGLAPFVIRILRLVTAVLVLTLLAVNASVWKNASLVVVLALSILNGV